MEVIVGHCSCMTKKWKQRNKEIINDDRTEWSPIRSVIIRVRTNWTTAQPESDLFITSMITTELDSTQSYYQLTIKKTISERIAKL